MSKSGCAGSAGARESGTASSRQFALQQKIRHLLTRQWDYPLNYSKCQHVPRAWITIVSRMADSGFQVSPFLCFKLIYASDALETASRLKFPDKTVFPMFCNPSSLFVLGCDATLQKGNRLVSQPN